MAYTQVDPARLTGDALRRWYLRSPADIEREQQTAAARRHDEFFGTTASAAFATEGRLPAGPGGDDVQHVASVATDQGHWSGSMAKPDEAGRRLAARDVAGSGWGNPARAQPAASGHVCRTCHRGGVPPLPPGGIFSFRDVPPSSPSSPSKPPEPDRKQCEQQLQSDTDTCAQQPNNAAKGVCREGAMKRYSHCRKTGEVGEPYLFTVPRMPR